MLQIVLEVTKSLLVQLQNTLQIRSFMLGIKRSIYEKRKFIDEREDNIKRFWRDFSETQIRNKLNKIREATENLNREVECA